MGFFGCHLSTSGGKLKMVSTALDIGANTFAFFTRNPRGSRSKSDDHRDCADALMLMRERGFGPVVAHGAYTMNLATADPESRAFAVEMLCEDLKRMAALPGNYYNFHPGSHVGQGIDAGIQHIVDALRIALMPQYPVTVLLETMTGKGSEIGGCFSHLRSILDGVGSENVGICLDTCHIWDAGYDIVMDLDGVLKEFDRIIGLSRLKAIHLNDSKNVLLSRKDRHACLGDGYLGIDTFRKIVNHPVLKELPMILETPNELSGYRREIAVLRSLEADQ